MITINAQEFARLKVDADKFDKTITRELRKRIKAIGQIGIDAVKKSLAEAPPNDQPGSEGSRAAVAASLRTVISFQRRSAGVRIIASNSRLSPEHRGFVAAYEKKALSHPVYGHEGTQVNQPTRPYFGASIHDALEKRGAPQVMAAIDDAVKAIGGRGK